MATTKSAFFTLQESALADSSKLVSPSGTVEFRSIPYSLVGTEDVADIIKILRLPIGAKVIPHLCSVICEDPGTTLTLDIGTAENTDGLADGIALSSGGRVEFTSGTMPAFALTETPLESNEVYATVASASTLTADAKIVFNIAWTPARF